MISTEVIAQFFQRFKPNVQELSRQMLFTEVITQSSQRFKPNLSMMRRHAEFGGIFIPLKVTSIALILSRGKTSS
jgi:hypothetical protein